MKRFTCIDFFFCCKHIARETVAMSSTHSSKSTPYTVNECSICLSALKQGSPILTLSCDHKYHFQCLMSSIRAQHKQCPLCRATIDESIVQLIAASRNNASYHSSRSSSVNNLFPTIHLSNRFLFTRIIYLDQTLNHRLVFRRFP